MTVSIACTHTCFKGEVHLKPKLSKIINIVVKNNISSTSGRKLEKKKEGKKKEDIKMVSVFFRYSSKQYLACLD